MSYGQLCTLGFGPYGLAYKKNKPDQGTAFFSGAAGTPVGDTIPVGSWFTIKGLRASEVKGGTGEIKIDVYKGGN